MNRPFRFRRPALLGTLAREARTAGGSVYLVGGAVRDALLGREPVDHDVAFEGPVEAALALVAGLSSLGFSCEARHDRFGTARLRAEGGERYDLAVTREERYPHPGALPVVRTGVPLGRDLERRDFTVHAMALPLDPAGGAGGLLDPFGGEADLGLRRIRLLHEGSFADDPTRVFRAARYAARLGFELDPGLSAAMQRAVESGAFARISGDRLRRAFEDLLAEENRAMAVQLLARLGVPAAVVEGWGVGADAVAALRAVATADDAWPALLAPLPVADRDRIATRLAFSRALRRRAGCPR